MLAWQDTGNGIYKAETNVNGTTHMIGVRVKSPYPSQIWLNNENYLISMDMLSGRTEEQCLSEYQKAVEKAFDMCVQRGRISMKHMVHRLEEMKKNALPQT